MESIRELYRIGAGPSSSHTMAPRRAAEIFLKRTPQAATYRVTLFSSLAATGKGHLTDRALSDTFGSRPLEIVWSPERQLPLHPNGMQFEALDAGGAVLDTWQVYSLGGGALGDASGAEISHPDSIYPITNMDAILTHCDESGSSLWEYVAGVEGEQIWPYLTDIWAAMQAAIERGIHAQGVLPGGLGLRRKAWVFLRRTSTSGPYFKFPALLSAYALAVSEENAAGGVIVTAPTCGSSGVLPGVLRFVQEMFQCDQADVLRGLATAGLIGNLIKENASISGAEVGCQGEIGTACAMAAGAAAQMLGGTVRQIEYAAEMGLEHHLGLTCDPVGGLVQIPCIERNAFAATRALTCAEYALFSDGTHRIPFDDVVTVMRETGKDMLSRYRETAMGGLAAAYHRRVKPAG
ncbi:MAG: L-serine ammonia-lyase [Chloroflexi bacterium]|nr:L-serine ammonia-lyase [Chloroflexota bacterium]